MMLRYLLLLTTALTITHDAGSQTVTGLPTDSLAEIGPTIITARDLIERIELMPWQGKDMPSQHDSAKVKALQSMVAEQLLALDASAQGIGTDSATMRYRENVERLLVRDELFKREVKAKVTVTDEEIRKGLRGYARQLRLLQFGVRTEKIGRELGRVLRTGIRPDSVVYRFPKSSFTHLDSLTVNFGGQDERLEDAAYTLDSKNRVSDPVRSQYSGWVVLYLVNHETNPDYAKNTLQDRVRVVERDIRQRRERQEGSRYQSTILAPKRASVSPDMFELIVQTSLGMLAADSAHYKQNGSYSLTTIVDRLADTLSPHLDRQCVEIENEGMTLADILEGFRNFQFSFPSLKEEDFRLRLNACIKQIVAAELMSREGYHKNLHQTEEVRHDAGVWSDYWVSRLLERKIFHSARVTDEDVLQYLVEHGAVLGEPYEVNIREILSDSLREALDSIVKIEQGANMAELARQVSKRTAWAKHGGESGYFRVSKSPELGFRALNQDPGKLVGPVLVKNQYSVFTVLGKRKSPSDSILTFDSLKTVVRQVVQQQKGQRAVNTYVASLAKSYAPKIHYDRLSRVAVLPANIVTKRMIGFGGIMVATPLLYPQWEWTREVKDLKQLVP
jgi:parvulin-like peptidyl-prolyl isomerase